MRALCLISRKRASKRHIHYDTLNREQSSIHCIEGKSSSGASLYYRSNSCGTVTANTSPDEIKFAKLMAFLSISFVICWMPQMVSATASTEWEWVQLNARKLPLTSIKQLNVTLFVCTLFLFLFFFRFIPTQIDCHPHGHFTESRTQGASFLHLGWCVDSVKFHLRSIHLRTQSHQTVLCDGLP